MQYNLEYFDFSFKYIQTSIYTHFLNKKLKNVLNRDLTLSLFTNVLNFCEKYFESNIFSNVLNFGFKNKMRKMSLLVLKNVVKWAKKAI